VTSPRDIEVRLSLSVEERTMAQLDALKKELGAPSITALVVALIDEAYKTEVSHA